MAKWTPSESDYRQVFFEQSPWLVDGQVPTEWAPPVERPLAQLLHHRLLQDRPHRFQLILGPRRVGKTTAMYQTVRRLLQAGVSPNCLRWMRLDHPLLQNYPLGEWVRSHLNLVAKGEILFLFLDEITYAGNWDLWLKEFHDQGWPLRLVGTSSSTAALRARSLESGVGRWEEQYLPPYSFFEYLELVGKNIVVPERESLAATLRDMIKFGPPAGDLETLRRRFLFTGGFPELLTLGHELDEASALLHSQRVLQSDAVERAVYKDIPQAFGVDNPRLLERLLYTLAGQITGMLSPSGICQSLGGMSQPTFDKYLTYLERAFLVFTLPNYSGSELSVQKRGRKVYFLDSAVRNAALFRGLGPLNDLNEMGLLQENMIASHLHAAGQLTQVRLYHWRDRDLEVDLIYDHPEEPLAFEISSSAAHSRGGLKAFQERFPRFRGRCYLVAPQIMAAPPDESGVGTLPLDYLLLASGAISLAATRRRLMPFPS